MRHEGVEFKAILFLDLTLAMHYYITPPSLKVLSGTAPLYLRDLIQTYIYP